MFIPIHRLFNLNQSAKGPRNFDNLKRIENPILNNNVIEQIGFEVDRLEE